MRRVLAAVCAVVLLASCRLDVTVDLTIDVDGTGEIVVTAVADADVVEQAPGLADDLRFDDARSAGWAVDGPTETDDEGLTVTLRHPVTSADDATRLLASLGPPFTGMALSRTVAGEEVTTSLAGQLVLADGFADFADTQLVEAVGGTPFADRLADADASPAASMSVTLRADLPGDVDATTGERRDGSLEWAAPLDGSSADLDTRAVQRPGSDGWEGSLATIALVVLVAWIAVAAAFITFVVVARRRRVQRRRASRSGL